VPCQGEGAVYRAVAALQRSIPRPAAASHCRDRALVSVGLLLASLVAVIGLAKALTR
jgi:hypothetical protein